ncbi:MAG: hypothetical protein R3286_02080 [Gammaproteobacteria bacterium]|nr:hypothetical protein [Gammaproteobacteria bacterium]
MRRIIAIGSLLLCVPFSTLAQDKPTPAEVRKVIDYYYEGKGKGVIPMEYKLCQQIAEQGANKNDCEVEIPAGKIKKGEDAYVWMKFLVPAEDQAKILLQFSRDNLVRDTSNVSLTGATRYRTWKKLPTDRVGEWSINIVEEMPTGDAAIGKLDFSVVEARQ